jgi:hypothetical protein
VIRSVLTSSPAYAGAGLGGAELADAAGAPAWLQIFLVVVAPFVAVAVEYLRARFVRPITRPVDPPGPVDVDPK